MAESNVRQLSPLLQLGCDTSTPEKVMPFTSADAHRVREWVLQARAIVRAVALAVTAQEDGSVSYDNGPEERWWLHLTWFVPSWGPCATCCRVVATLPTWTGLRR